MFYLDGNTVGQIHEEIRQELSIWRTSSKPSLLSTTAASILSANLSTIMTWIPHLSPTRFPGATSNLTNNSSARLVLRNNSERLLEVTINSKSCLARIVRSLPGLKLCLTWSSRASFRLLLIRFYLTTLRPRPISLIQFKHFLSLRRLLTRLAISTQTLFHRFSWLRRHPLRKSLSQASRRWLRSHPSLRCRLPRISRLTIWGYSRSAVRSRVRDEICPENSFRVQHIQTRVLSYRARQTFFARFERSYPWIGSSPHCSNVTA